MPAAPLLYSLCFRASRQVVVDRPDRYLESQELGPRNVVLVFTLQRT